MLCESGIDLLETAALIACTHHERWDGKGYPRGLAGEDIPLAGRIVAVVDTFDALTTERVYRPTKSFAEAVAVLEAESGKQFDPNAAPIAPLPPPAPVQGPKPPTSTGSSGSSAGNAVGPTLIQIIQQVAPQQGVQGVAVSSRLAVSRLSLARRISVTRLRARGLRASMNVQPGTAVVRIAISKARNRAETGRALLTAIRTPRSAGVYRVTLRGSVLSNLETGRYVMEIRAGRSAASFGAAQRVAFQVTR